MITYLLLTGIFFGWVGYFWNSTNLANNIIKFAMIGCCATNLYFAAHLAGYIVRIR